MLKCLNDSKGVAAFPAILGVSAVILIIGLAIAFSGRIESNISANQRSSSQAFHVSQAGINDATMKVVRDFNFEDLEGYSLTTINGDAIIEVDKDSPAVNKTTIISEGTVKKVKRRIKVILDIDAQGKVTLDSWEEMTD